MDLKEKNIENIISLWTEAILYIHNGIAGIHAVGVLPTKRKMGFADEIMKALINTAVEGRATHEVLQASKMGIGIYKRMGFQEDFLFTNYYLAEG